ncbi:MAG: nitroreductase [Erysipelotrichia bacterium]|nr:nitroreductase [Erysipelotrichia bacterium]NCC55351.1 nitroreductase [Erysipelotrichia bacterium]
MLEVIKQRKSIRQYSDRKVSDKDLNTVLEAAQLAPTWKNKQCFEMIVIDDKETQAKLGVLLKNNPCESAYTKASYTLVFIANPSKSGNRDGKPYYMCDSAIAMEHAILTATSLGLATCWVGVFPEDALKQLLNIPEQYRIVALTPLGYSDEKEVNHTSRRKLEDIVHYNQF